MLITVVSVLTLREFYRLMRAAGYTPFDKLGLVFGGLIYRGGLVRPGTPPQWFDRLRRQCGP